MWHRRASRDLTLFVLLDLSALPERAPVGQSAPAPEACSARVAWEWFDQLFDVIAAENTSPPVAARIHAVSALALYEAVVPGSAERCSLAGKVRERLVQGLEESFEGRCRAETRRVTFEASVTRGKQVAEAVLSWARSDGFAGLDNAPYEAPPVPGAWRITPDGTNPKPLQPSWGRLLPMVLATSIDCAPQGHPEFSTDAASRFHAAARKVYEIGKGLSAEQKSIALLLADRARSVPPPPVVPRTFASFHAEANEAALSRLYGGIHYEFDNDDGLASGRCVGRAILDALESKKESAASLRVSR